MKRSPSARRGEGGYAVLMVVFVATLMLIAVMTVGPSIYTQGQREKEMELQWRGKQYVRGIKLYYRKTGKFPASLEDLTKANAGVRYMRKAYTDPVNVKDGSWRLIYVSPNGALIGSMRKDRSPLQLVPAGGPGHAAAGNAGNPGGAPGNPNPQNQNPSSGTPTPGPLQSPSSASPGDTPRIFGGNIIGVGSKIDRHSVMVYDKAQKYIEWEFIWDPAKEASVTVGQPARPVGQPIGAPPGNPPPAPQNPRN